MLKIYDVKINNLINPIGIDGRDVTIGWKLQSDKHGVIQYSYQLKFYDAEKLLWDSGITISEQTVGVKCPRIPCKTQIRYLLKTTAKDEIGDSEIAECTGFFETGLDENGFSGIWIEPIEEFAPDDRKPAIYLRKKFIVNKNIVKARIYQTAHGLYEFYINGKFGTEEKFKPGLTSYYQRIQYQTYDITDLLINGENCWTVVLADGWWRGVTGGTVANNYGYKLAYIGQIELSYSDGTKEVVPTDLSFKCGVGGLLASDMQMGEIFDARKEPFGWKFAEYDDKAWNYAIPSSERYESELCGKTVEPVREKEIFFGKPFRDKAGNLVIDFSQNIAGYVKCKLHGCVSGQKIKFVYGEILKDGVFTVENIRSTVKKLSAFQQVEYICKDSEEEYCPQFAVFGFRYVKVEGYNGEISEGDFMGIAVYSDCEYKGDFICSNELINKLVENSRWSQKGNFLEVPTDCPTRERNAWTGDAQVYAPTANRFADLRAFFEKWLTDMRIEQYASGKVGITAPSTSSVHNSEELKRVKEINPLQELAGPTGNGNIGEDCAGWGDACVWIPYIDYLYYGNKDVLRKEYPMSKKWIDYMLSCAKDKNPLYENEPQYSTYTNGELDADYIYDTRMHYGEWQEPINEPNLADLKSTFARLLKEGKPKVATAYMCRSADNVAYMASQLGYNEDAEYYKKIADKIRRVYDKYFIADNGTIEKGHQAAYVRVLAMRLCSDKKREAVIKQLLSEIQKNDNKLNTGFLSTPFLLPVLADNGYADVAYRILENTEYPSWLHSVVKGATTITESWHSVDKCEGSFNHYAYGAVCDFLFGYIGGIRVNKNCAGYKKFFIKPVVGGSLEYAHAEYESIYGKIVSEWKRKNGRVFYRFEIPVGTEAEITLANGETFFLKSGIYERS